MKKIARDTLANTLNGKRLYVSEDRAHHCFTLPNTIQYTTHAHAGTVSQFEAIIANTDGQDVSWTGDPTDLHRSFRITDYKVYSRIRNLSPHPCYITAWVLTPRRHLDLQLAIDDNAREQVLNKIQVGWRALLDVVADPYASAVSTYADGYPYMNCQSSFLYPSHSQLFRTHYKILGKKKFLVPSGGNVHITMKVPDFTFNKGALKGIDASEGNSAQEITLEAIKNITRFLLLRFHGEMGQDVAIPDKIGFLTADLGTHSQTKARVMELNTKDNTIGLRVIADTVTDLEGPTEYDAKADT